jgi:GTP cyclohydrolase I
MCCCGVTPVADEPVLFADYPLAPSVARWLERVLDELKVPYSETTRETGLRWATALIEMTAGLRDDPSRWLERTFPPEADDPGMVIVPGIEFASLCEHHMLPFTGTIVVGYVPHQGGQIVGLSKIPRMVLGYAARPQVQERLGNQIIGAIMSSGIAEGAGAIIRSVHTCMTARGVRAHGASMTTSHLAGVFKDNTQTRSEFLALTHGR